MGVFRTALWTLLLSAVLTAVGQSTKKHKPSVFVNDSTLAMEIVSFRGQNGLFQGYFYKPDGKGSFPGVIFLPELKKPLTQSGPPSQFDEVAKFWTTKGYTFFIPDHTPRPADAPGASSSSDEEYMERMQVMHRDLVAATEWFKARSTVDETRVVLTGAMYGGTQAIFAGDKGLNVSAIIPFSPGSLSWNALPVLQAALRRGIRSCKVPIFLIQTQNDKTLAPSAILGKELMNKGVPNRTKVFPPFGTSNADARNFAVKGSQVWGGDVIAFLNEVMPEIPSAAAK